VGLLLYSKSEPMSHISSSTKIFFVLLDITKVNTYIKYLDWCKQNPNPMRYLLTHLQFKNTLYKALLVGWIWCNLMGDCKHWVHKKAITLEQFLGVYTFRAIKRKLDLQAISNKSIFNYNTSQWTKNTFFLFKITSECGRI
jgi:hypothetical protein